jgi:serine/threonine-protein kinase
VADLEGDAPNRWRQLAELFDHALDVAPAERSAWVTARTSHDPSLRDDLLRMLAAHDEPFGVLDKQVVPPVPQGESLLERLRPALHDRYVISRTLGRGGMATVFLARELKHDRNVVIKVLDPAAARAFGARRFHEEVRIAARLSHPHILALIDSGDADGLLYYVMPHIDGETLRERLHARGSLPMSEGLPLLRDVADALAHSHGCGVIHRDLKPDNILCAGGHAYLLDFGVAKRAASQGGARLRHETDAGHAIGTPGYMSPEQASGQRVDARSDVYAWGLVATETLAGVAERGALDERTVPVPLAQLIHQCLSIDAADRPSSAREIVAALDSMSGASHAVTQVQLPRSRSRVLFAVGAFALIGAGASAWWQSRDEPVVRNERLPMPVAVAPLQNETGDSTLTVWGRLASDWLTQGLEETGAVTVVPWASVRSAADQSDDAPTFDVVTTLAREAAAATVVSGSYYLIGDSIRVQLAVTDARQSRSLGALPALEAHRDSLSLLMRMMRDRLQGFVALQLDDRVLAPAAIGQVPPTYDAYRAFDRGLELYTGQQYSAAATELRAAYARDTTFLAPLIFAAMGHWNTGELEWTDTLVSMLQARRTRLTPYADAMTTHLSALLASDGERALQAIRTAAEISPGLRAEYSVAHHALAMNRPKEALAALDGVDPDRGLMRGWSSYWTQIAHAHHLLSQHDAEFVAATQMRRRYPQNRASAVFAVRALSAGGKFVQVDSLLDTLSRLPADVYWSYGAALVVAGEARLEKQDTARANAFFRHAVRWLRERQALDPEDRGVLAWLGNAEYQLGNDREAERIYRELVTLFPERLRYRGWHAVVLTRLNRHDEAQRVLGAPPRYARGEYTTFLARMAAVRGESARAASLLEQAQREGYTRWPWFPSETVRDFAPIRADAEVARLIP